MAKGSALATFSCYILTARHRPDQCGSALGEFQYAIGIALVSPEAGASAGASSSGSVTHAWVADNGNKRVSVFAIGAPASAFAWTALSQIKRIGKNDKEGENAGKAEENGEGEDEDGDRDDAAAATLGEPFDVAFTSDGRLALVSVPESHCIHVFDAVTRAHVRTLGMLLG